MVQHRIIQSAGVFLLFTLVLSCGSDDALFDSFPKHYVISGVQFNSSDFFVCDNGEVDLLSYGLNETQKDSVVEYELQNELDEFELRQISVQDENWLAITTSSNETDTMLYLYLSSRQINFVLPGLNRNLIMEISEDESELTLCLESVFYTYTDSLNGLTEHSAITSDFCTSIASVQVAEAIKLENNLSDPDTIAINRSLFIYALQ